MNLFITLEGKVLVGDQSSNITSYF